MRRAKIVCTLGPASSEPSFIGDLIDEGMNVARINFSHGEYPTHAARIKAVREQAQLRGRPVAILQDLQGPKIRVGRFPEGKIELEAGSDFLVTTRQVEGSPTQVSTTYTELPHDVRPGNLLLLDDGMLSLEVERVDGPDVYTRVVVGGTLKNNKGINLPGVKVSAPALTAKDKEDLAFGLDLGVDFVALSFVRSASDVKEAVALCKRPDRYVPIIAKIERPEAVECLPEIIDVADGIMVARGDLGVEMGAEKVPLIQKRAIEETNARGKVVITATQMLESMIGNPQPTRAEVSDVANAILDGSDAVMLSGETAAGKYPLLAVRTMARIIEEMEASQRYQSSFRAVTLNFTFSTYAIAKSAVVASRLMEARTIVCVSDSGGAARLVSEHRPEARIVALTSRQDTYQRLALHWGVEPFCVPRTATFEEMLQTIEKLLVERKFCKKGDLAIITVGLPLEPRTSSSTMHVLEVGR